MPKGHQVALTSQQDEIIRKCWENNAYGHHAAKRAAQLAGITLEVAQRRATQLGLIFTRERHRWTEAELRIVEQHAHLALDTIQRKLRPVSPPGVKRTRAAIAKQIFAQRFRGNMDGLKHEPLAQALGISGERLHKLRAARLIDGQRLESIREACGYGESTADEHRHWFYPNDQIVRLLFAARGELDLRKVNQTWLMGLLESYITLFQPTRKELARSERERTKLAQRRSRKRRRLGTEPSTNTRRRRLGLLDDSAVAAIRAGRSVAGTRRASTGAAVRSKNGSGAAISPSVTPSSGPAGAPSAV
jgi:hypothetical protein